jgi:hypothetical protein
MRGFFRRKPDFPGQQFLHHGLFEVAGLGEALFQTCKFRIDVGQYLGDSCLFADRRNRDAQFRNVRLADSRDLCSDGIEKELLLDCPGLKGIVPILVRKFIGLALRNDCMQARDEWDSVLVHHHDMLARSFVIFGSVDLRRDFGETFLSGMSSFGILS